ncbi:hypothetical protein [Stenotrophomonas sp. SY1]|jgi:hypothetical protein|uniref:hypothetical protein n=1 Tax=Stenotrophomonas sp. SY1 TaxID=477235 RepID=UPI001E5CAAA5|nr:hypothetical protein [Stenotrophomonas sp. SY1]MCD9086616.1 hypothetical protein [Stenotrophomonas sp. SY1]
MNEKRVVELPKSGIWLNAAPATLQDMRGRPVVLAFVNGTSVWSMQRVAEVTHWLARNPGRVHLVVVQVPRFEFEREPQQSLKLLRRHGVSAPILLDAQWDAWRQFEVQSWPTLVLLDAAGQERERLVGGAGDLERALNSLCEGLLRPLDEESASVRELNAEPRLPLQFPGGLAVTADRLYIADTGHHRVLECTHSGRVLRQFGLATADLVNGGLGEAAFNRPQGLALVRDVLYVADTGNHAVRRINLMSGQVDTLCGSGRAGDPKAGVLAQPWDSALNHPVDVAVADNQILIAMAGDNHIWSYDLGSRELRWRAGAGVVEVRDGSGHLAAFAQPASLMAVQQTLYVCDALGSAIRSVQLRGDLVQTLVGQGPWESGNVDGPRLRARLQYPTAIAMGPDSPLLWIADAGNGLLRTLRLGGGDLSTVNLPRRLHGPCALAVAAGAIWIAESDAHAVLRFDPLSGELGDVPIEG